MILILHFCRLHLGIYYSTSLALLSNHRLFLYFLVVGQVPYDMGTFVLVFVLTIRNQSLCGKQYAYINHLISQFQFAKQLHYLS